MATDDDTAAAFDTSDIERVLGEAAGVLRTIGFAGGEVTIIGGMVPSLLVPVVDPAYSRPHVGTRDVDLCLSLALIEGGVEGYERIETQLKRAGFIPSSTSSFRWTHPSGTEIEFFCPAGDERVAGRMYRPPAGPAKQTMGGKLSALALGAGELLVADRRAVAKLVDLPDGGGRITFEFPVTGPAGFLAAKVDALRERSKNKDAYDIVWLLEAWPGGPAAVATEIEASGVAFPDGVVRLRTLLADSFADADSHGARAYVSFANGGAGDPDERAGLALRAAGAVQEFLGAFSAPLRQSEV